MFFFFNDTATTEIYTLSLHDALPISPEHGPDGGPVPAGPRRLDQGGADPFRACLGDVADRKSTRLNSSHGYISYAVFCLKKKNSAARSAPRPPRGSCMHHECTTSVTS